MKNFRELEESAWNHFSTVNDIGNSHYYEDDGIEFNGKESIMIYDAAQMGKEVFQIAFRKWHYQYLYFKSLE
jgi:hypothetical protein